MIPALHLHRARLSTPSITSWDPSTDRVQMLRPTRRMKDGQAAGMKKSLNLCVLFSVQYSCVYSGYGLAFWQGIRRHASGEIDEAGDVVT